MPFERTIRAARTVETIAAFYPNAGRRHAGRRLAEFPVFEIESDIDPRLVVDDFPLIDDAPVHLRRDYHMREMYTRAGATYSGGTQQWSILL